MKKEKKDKEDEKLVKHETTLKNLYNLIEKKGEKIKD